jgi:hypothetical protein
MERVHHHGLPGSLAERSQMPKVSTGHAAEGQRHIMAQTKAS